MDYHYHLTVVSRDDSVKPVDLAMAKADLDVTFADDDALIEDHLASATSWVENYLNQFLVPVVLRLYAGTLPSIFYLPRGPVREVTTITVDGVAVAGFRTIAGSSYAVLPPEASPWPATANRMGSVIEYQAGYAVGTVPARFLAAIKAVLSIYYDKPTGNELASQWAAVERMLGPSRWRSI